MTLSFCLPITALAQETASDEEVLRVNTDLLIFPIRIRSKANASLETLAERDLTLIDKDKVTSGLYLYRGLDRVGLVFALDQSGSTRDIISQQRDAAIGLFGKFGERSRVAVVRFAQTASLVAPFDRDIDIASAAFEIPVAMNQRTAIFDAATAAIALFTKLPRVRSERRIVILLSDGLDNASRSTSKTVVESAIQNAVSFYVIHIPLFEPRNGRLSVRTPASGFRQLAEKTGGKYFLVGDAKSALVPQRNVDLTPIFEAIEDDLKSQFLLGFYLNESANDGRRHEFSLAMPQGFEYQVSSRGFERTQKFFVKNPQSLRQRQ